MCDNELYGRPLQKIVGDHGLRRITIRLFFRVDARQKTQQPQSTKQKTRNTKHHVRIRQDANNLSKEKRNNKAISNNVSYNRNHHRRINHSHVVLTFPRNYSCQVCAQPGIVSWITFLAHILITEYIKEQLF